MVDYCINCVLVFDLFTIILLVVAPQTFIDIPKNKFYTCPSSERAVINA